MSYLWETRNNKESSTFLLRKLLRHLFVRGCGLARRKHVMERPVEPCRKLKVVPAPNHGLATVKSPRTLSAWTSGQEG